MAYCTGSHTKFYHRYHIVWVTKYRFKVLHGDMRVRLREIIFPILRVRATGFQPVCFS